MNLDNSIAELSAKLPGPVCVLGAGGFIGFNLFNYLTKIRNDVYGVCRDVRNNWRIGVSDISRSALISCDLLDINQTREHFQAIKPATVFNFSAYGAYSKQREYRMIYQTNFNAAIDILEMLKLQNFKVYLHAGSNSEYGLNSMAPEESGEMIPNSHYAVSKAASSYAIKYFGKIEHLPVANLRIYSVYGPWEEPDRLIPTLVHHARRKQFPPFVNPLITRDFIFITDVISAFITVASGLQPGNYGDSFNIGTGIKTTIGELAKRTGEIFKIPGEARFGDMPDRSWDMPDWSGNISKMKRCFQWTPLVNLEEGLMKVAGWQEEINFDKFIWTK